MKKASSSTSQARGKNEFNGNSGFTQLKGDGKTLRDDESVGEFKDECKKKSGVAVKYGDITIILYLDSRVGEIYADKERITQVLSNIIQNSIKFTEVGTIEIKTRQGQSISKISTIRDSDHTVSYEARF